MSEPRIKKNGTSISRASSSEILKFSESLPPLSPRSPVLQDLLSTLRKITNDVNEFVKKVKDP